MTSEGEKVVPIMGEQRMFIKHLHYIAGHVGFKRTLKLITQYYWWPKMVR